MKNKWVVILSSLLVLLFLYTGLVKFRDLQQFAGEMRNQVFPKTLVPYITWLIPSAEIGTALLLLFDRTHFAGLLSSFVLMLLFTVYTALVLLHMFNRVPCSCGGVIRSLSWGQHLVFNLFFLAVAVTAIKLCMHANRGNRKPEEKSRYHFLF